MTSKTVSYHLSTFLIVGCLMAGQCVRLIIGPYITVGDIVLRFILLFEFSYQQVPNI